MMCADPVETAAQELKRVWAFARTSFGPNGNAKFVTDSAGRTRVAKSCAEAALLSTAAENFFVSRLLLPHVRSLRAEWGDGASTLLCVCSAAVAEIDLLGAASRSSAAERRALLTSILRGFAQLRSANGLLFEALSASDRRCALPIGSSSNKERLVAETSLCGHFSEQTSAFLASLATGFRAQQREETRAIDEVPVFEIGGLPSRSSRLVRGAVIERELHAPSSETRAAMLASWPSPIPVVLAWTQEAVGALLALQSFPRLLLALCSVSLHELLRHELRVRRISFADSVPETALNRIAEACAVPQISSAFEYLLLDARVSLLFPELVASSSPFLVEPLVKPLSEKGPLSTFVLCAPSSDTLSVRATSLRRTVRLLSSSRDSPLVPAGGCWEATLAAALLGLHRREPHNLAAVLLAKALRSVPETLLHNAARTQTAPLPRDALCWLLSEITDDDDDETGSRKGVLPDGTIGEPAQTVGAVEPLHLKHAILWHALAFVESLLRIDSVVSVRHRS